MQSICGERVQGAIHAARLLSDSPANSDIDIVVARATASIVYAS